MTKPLLRIAMAAVALMAVISTVRPAPAHAQEDPPSTGPGVTIATVPPVAGIEVTLDGETARTNVFGGVTFPNAEPRDAVLRLDVVTKETVAVDGERFTLERIYGTSRDLVLAYGTERPVRFTYTTVQGTPVPPERIESMTLKSTVGDVIEVTDNVGDEMMLRSSRVVSRTGGPVVSTIQWSVMAVMVDGSNVVNRAEVRFEPSVTSEVDVPVLFFTARVHVVDAFFGYSQGGTLEVSHPDGSTTSHPIPDDGVVVLPDLPRGDYEVLIEGRGVRLKRPLVLSRDQDIRLELLSWVDLATVVLVGLTFAVIPMVIGTRRRRRRASEEGDEASTGDEEQEGDERAQRAVTATSPEPQDPVEPDVLIVLDEPDVLVEPDEPPEPAESPEPTKAAKPPVLVEPDEPDEPDEPPEPAKSPEPTKAAKPPVLVEPREPDYPPIVTPPVRPPAGRSRANRPLRATSRKSPGHAAKGNLRR